MPGTPLIIGDDTVLWGSSGAYATGIIASASKRLTGEEGNVKDNNGFEVATIYYDDRTEVEFEMIVQTAAPALDRGDLITVGGQANCEVKEVEQMWSQTDVRKLRVRGVFYHGKTYA